MGFQGGGVGGGGGVYNFLRVLILGSQNTQDWPLFKSFQTIFMFPSKVDKKNTLWWFFVSTILKMSPVLSLALEPISSFSYQE